MPGSIANSDRDGSGGEPMAQTRNWWAVLVLAAVTIGACVGNGSASRETVAYRHGQWWDGERFASREMYVRSGVFVEARGPVARSVDLSGHYLIPPMAEGEPALIDQYNACYLADGVFYVRDMANMPYAADQIRPHVNRPNTVDWVSAMTGFTGPGGHPVEQLDQFVKFGFVPADWTPDYDGLGVFIVTSREDIDARLPLLAKQDPTIVKTFLSFSEDHERNQRDPTTRGQHRGMDPRLLPYLVERAHAMGLRVATHVYTAFDYRTALAAGVDEIAHFPGLGIVHEPNRAVRDFQITREDAEATARRGVVVHTTLAWLIELRNENPTGYQRALDEVVVPNLRLLQEAGVQFVVGSDQFRHNIRDELAALEATRQFSNAEVLNLVTRDTPRRIFPHRRIGALEPGFEASFVALDGDPSGDLASLRKVSLRVKRGIPLDLSSTATARTGDSCISD